MIAWEKTAFATPFELWREDGILHLVMAKGAQLEVSNMKEVIRLISALDHTGKAPVLLEFPEMAFVTENARNLLQRVCTAQGHPVAFFTHDNDSKRQGEVFLKFCKPEFPFRVFGWRDDAVRWAIQNRDGVKVLA